MFHSLLRYLGALTQPRLSGDPVGIDVQLDQSAPDSKSSSKGALS